MPESLLRIAVIGAGHLGSRHAQKYAALAGVRLAAVCDVDIARARAAAQPSGAAAFSDYRKVKDVDAVSVVTPTVTHHEVAAHFIDRGIHALVEKPIARSVTEARDLVDRARAKGVKLQVGHVERFNPALAGAMSFIKNPLFIEVHRIAPFSFRSIDIGVIMDLMIHDLDIVLHVTGESPQHIAANGACVITEMEDIAGARLEFPSGCVANLTASRLGLKHERKFRIFQRNCYISLDFLAREGYVVTKGPGFDSLDLKNIDPEVFKDPLQFLTRNLIEMKPIPAVEDSDPLRDELAAFVRCIREDTAPIVTGEHGLRAIETAERIRSAARIIKNDK
jgi:predicted dehydrogenase